MMKHMHIQANDITQHLRVREGGDVRILFIHGNGSDGGFWESLMRALPENITAAAPDLRGYGDTEAKPARASDSFGDYVIDLTALINALGWSKYHVVGHSLGAGICWELMLKDAHRIQSVTLVNPASPFGFGGTSTHDGKLTFPDGAGSGGGIVNPEFVRLLQEGDRSTDNPTSPLNVMNTFYWAPPVVPEMVDNLLDGLLKMKIGDRFYPGDSVPSVHFPFAAPGAYGQLNAAAPLTKQGIAEALAALSPKPPVLWVRGAKDQIVSDKSLFDTAVHGAAGLIPGYPGVEICPPQPMVAQTRFVLEKYAAAGGVCEEQVMEHCAHSPYIEDPEGFLSIFKPFIASR
jgi:pimeloyl-ACP methyl ester carboxylesterase